MLQPSDDQMGPVKALVALGSNAASSLGPPVVVLRAALSALTSESVRVEAVSRYFSTPAFPAGSGPDYVNAAAVLSTDLHPEALLQRLHAVERDLGRERRRRWEARVVDLDLLAWGAAVLPDLKTFEHWRKLPLAAQKQEAPDGLVLPHPRLQDRSFVLIPLLDVAPDWRHPVLAKTVTEMAAALSEADRRSVVPL